MSNRLLSIFGSYQPAEIKIVGILPSKRISFQNDEVTLFLRNSKPYRFLSSSSHGFDYIRVYSFNQNNKRVRINANIKILENRENIRIINEKYDYVVKFFIRNDLDENFLRGLLCVFKLEYSRESQIEYNNFYVFRKNKNSCNISTTKKFVSYCNTLKKNPSPPKILYFLSLLINKKEVFKKLREHGRMNDEKYFDKIAFFEDCRKRTRILLKREYVIFKKKLKDLKSKTEYPVMSGIYMKDFIVKRFANNLLRNGKKNEKIRSEAVHFFRDYFFNSNVSFRNSLKKESKSLFLVNPEFSFLQLEAYDVFRNLFISLLELNKEKNSDVMMYSNIFLKSSKLGSGRNYFVSKNSNGIQFNDIIEQLILDVERNENLLCLIMRSGGFEIFLNSIKPYEPENSRDIFIESIQLSVIRVFRVLMSEKRYFLPFFESNRNRFIGVFLKGYILKYTHHLLTNTCMKYKSIKDLPLRRHSFFSGVENFIRLANSGKMRNGTKIFSVDKEKVLRSLMKERRKQFRNHDFNNDTDEIFRFLKCFLEYFLPTGSDEENVISFPDQDQFFHQLIEISRNFLMVRFRNRNEGKKDECTVDLDEIFSLAGFIEFFNVLCEILENQKKKNGDNFGNYDLSSTYSYVVFLLGVFVNNFNPMFCAFEKSFAEIDASKLSSNKELPLLQTRMALTVQDGYEIIYGILKILEKLGKFDFKKGEAEILCEILCSRKNYKSLRISPFIVKDNEEEISDEKSLLIYSHKILGSSVTSGEVMKAIMKVFVILSNICEDCCTKLVITRIINLTASIGLPGISKFMKEQSELTKAFSKIRGRYNEKLNFQDIAEGVDFFMNLTGKDFEHFCKEFEDRGISHMMEVPTFISGFVVNTISCFAAASYHFPNKFGSIYEILSLILYGNSKMITEYPIFGYYKKQKYLKYIERKMTNLGEEMDYIQRNRKWGNSEVTFEGIDFSDCAKKKQEEKGNIKDISDELVCKFYNNRSAFENYLMVIEWLISFIDQIVGDEDECSCVLNYGSEWVLIARKDGCEFRTNYKKLLLKILFGKIEEHKNYFIVKSCDEQCLKSAFQDYVGENESEMYNYRFSIGVDEVNSNSSDDLRKQVLERKIIKNSLRNILVDIRNKILFVVNNISVVRERQVYIAEYYSFLDFW